LKPQNILFVKGQLKIADFGFTNAINKTISSGVSFAGTQPYLAPEIFLDKPRATHSDIWSAGVILFYLATQQLPFKTENSDSLKQQILNSKIPEMPEIFSKEFQNIIYLMLRRNFRNRSTAEKLLAVIGEDFPQIPAVHTFQTDRILENFRQVRFSDFTKFCEFDSNDFHEGSFLLFSSFFRNQIELETNKFYQINFKKNQILLTSYSIKSETRNLPISWEIETLINSNVWIIVDQLTNFEEMKVPEKEMVFNLAQPLLCSTLRITFLESTGEYSVSISQIELFGSIIDDQKVLQNFFKRTQEISIVKQMTFNFSDSDHNGLFKFITLGSLNKCKEKVSTICPYSKKNSLSTNLMY
jgi:serine/threonine protein kinase